MAIKASAAVTLSSIRDLQSCTRYYLLQSSTSAQPEKPTANPPGGDWVTAEPTYTTGSTNSLYFCDLNVFSDGTFAYSDVSLSSSYEAAKAAYNKAANAEDVAQAALVNTECIVGTQTAVTNLWTGQASFPTLQDGQVIMYWIPYAGTSTAATLTLTLSDGSTTGGKTVYINGVTRCTTQISAGNMVQMVYRENVTIGSGAYTGWWICRSLNDNTYDRIRLNNAIKAKTAIAAPRLIVGDSDGYYSLEAGVSFDIDKPILWAASNISANATSNNTYLGYPSCSLRINAGNDWVGTQNSTLYLAGTLTGKTFTVASEDWLTTNPFNELLTYISLGYLYSTYQMYFYPEHPIFRMYEGVPTTISQIAYEAQVAANAAQATADVARSEFRRVVRIDNAGLHVGDNQSNGEVLIDSESVNVVMNGTRYSKFAGNYVQFGNYQLRQSSEGGLVFKMNS